MINFGFGYVQLCVSRALVRRGGILSGELGRGPSQARCKSNLKTQYQIIIDIFLWICAFLTFGCKQPTNKLLGLIDPLSFYFPVRSAPINVGERSVELCSYKFGRKDYIAPYQSS